ncbi:photosystem I assembly BtpA, partial [Akkermansia muciniphila]
MIGMVHCLPLPGTMGYGGDMGKIIEQAVADAVLLEQVGFDAIIVENMGDAPFAAKMDEEQKAALAV